MKYDEFIGHVQQRARLASRGEAERATAATLTTLGERLAGGEPLDLGSQLPRELQDNLVVGLGQREDFSLDEFFSRVSEREGTPLPDAVHHARAVVSVLMEAVSRGEVGDVLDQLPADWRPLFQGSEGEMRAA